MALYRMLPPPPTNLFGQPSNMITTVNGRTYIGVANTPQDVPDFDGKLLESSCSWQKVADIGTGTTAQRQAQSLLPKGQGAPNAGDEFMDETLNMIVVFDGVNWHRPDTGAIV